MVSFLSIFLPYLLLLFFLARSIKEPVYLTGIFFLLLERYCIFFENVKIFDVPGRLGNEILFLIWMIIIWIFLRVTNFFKVAKTSNTGNPENPGNKSGINILDYFVIGLIIISLLDLIFVFIEYNYLDNIFREFFIFSSLFIGFFILKDIFRNVEPSVLPDFFFSIVVVNSIASFLYILHQGLHIPIYLSEEHTVEIFQGQIITRTFWFMPLLCFFAISYLMVFFKRKPIIYLILLAINILALFISYTRSYVLITVLLIILYFVLNSYKEKKFSKAITNIVLTCVAGVVIFIAVSKLFPTSTNYFVERFADLKENPLDESKSMGYRFARTSSVFEKVVGPKVLTGFGPVSTTQIAWVEDVRVITWDLVWTGVVFRWGYAGLCLFILLYIFAIIKALQKFSKTDSVLSKLMLVLLLVTVSQLLESIVSSTFLSGDRFAMGLWYLGILSGLLSIKENRIPKIKEVEGE